MKRIFHKEAIEQALDRFRVLEHFTNPELPFYLVQYEAGEMIASPDQPMQYVHFVLEGTVSIYSIRGDGSLYELRCSNREILLGDMEFATGENLSFWAEAKTSVTTLCLSLEEHRKELLSDAVFLRFIMRSLAEKVKDASNNEASFCTLEDKLLHYIQYQCENQRLSHVGNAALALHCSRRQLQRILKKLTEEHVLQKTGKGSYVLTL